jgi:hypothetical protein
MSRFIFTDDEYAELEELWDADETTTATAGDLDDVAEDDDQ